MKYILKEYTEEEYVGKKILHVIFPIEDGVNFGKGTSRINGEMEISKVITSVEYIDECFCQ